MKKHLLWSTLILAALLCLAACGNAQNGAAPASEAPGANAVVEAEAERRTLSISVDYAPPWLRTVIERFEELHPGVDVLLNDYGGDFQKFERQVGTQLMAGTADDILDGTIYNQSTADSGYFADFYPLMRNDPAFNEEDYYMGIIKSREYRGKLLAFQLDFSHTLIGVNNLFSAELVERFRQYDIISFRQVLDLYYGLADKGGHYLADQFFADEGIRITLRDQIDFENKTCDFTNAAFIQYIEDVKNATDPEQIYKFPEYQRTAQEAAAEKYLFQLVNPASYTYAALLPYAEKEVFTHYIPIIRENGYMNMGTPNIYCISEASQNKDLAWEFIKFSTTPQANENITAEFLPVNKKTYQDRVAAGLTNVIETVRLQEALQGETEEIVKQVMARFEQYNKMEIRQRFPLSNALRDMLIEAGNNFMRGVMTTEQVASDLQNKVSICLME